MRFLNGTVRTISLFAWLPVVIGAWLAGAHGLGLFYGSLGAVLAVGFSNALNNLIDRFQDRHDPRKETVAVTRPAHAYWIALFLLPGVAATLREMTYNNVLLAVLFYTGYLYSYMFGRVRYLKRIVVAACIAGTAFIATPRYPPALWMWALSIFAWSLLHETRKDKEDTVEDKQFRFVMPQEVDWWCILAPVLASLIFVVSVWCAKHRVELSDLAVAMGITIAVMSCIQIRTKYGQYRMRFLHRVPAGRMGAVVSLVGLMPSFLNLPLNLVVWANVWSIVYRSYWPARMGAWLPAVLHDALLWASLPFIAMLKVGVYPPILIGGAALIFLITSVREGKRLGVLRFAQ